MRTVIVSAIAVAALCAPAALARSPKTARAAFVNAEGRGIGEVNLTQTPSGVLMRLSVTGLPPGPHAVHVHEAGQCDQTGGFESAGGHYAPRGNQHGYEVEGEPHAGDLPNQWVSNDGLLRADILAPHVSLTVGQATLFDADGSALIVHPGTDDYRSQPSGNAGQRIACAVVVQG